MGYASLKEVLVSKFNIYPYNLIPLILQSFKKPFLVGFKTILRRYPFEAELKDGQKVIISGKGYKTVSFYAYLYLSRINGKNISVVEIDNETIKILYNNYEITIKQYNLGDILGVFVREDYGDVDVQGRTVLDCGAAIGDSSIYFALRGAKRVIALEAYPKVAKLAEENIQINAINNVYVVNAACGRDGVMTIDPQLGGGSTPLLQSDTGITIPSYSLRTIIKKFNVERDSVIKIDCEGCEYDLILHENEETLSYFSQIVMEYHLGYSILKRKLERAGFKVKVSRPSSGIRDGGITGMLYAYKN